MSNNADMKDYEAVALSLLLDDSGSEGEELSDVFYNAIINLSEADLKFQTPNLGEVRNANGSLRKVKRLDYSRGPKRIKTADPWTDIYWLELISDPTTNDPSHRNGKEFRRMFRTPFPVFKKIVGECRATNDPAFNYESNIKCNETPIPLELKILFVLRVLASGLLMKDGAEMTNRFISNTTGNSFFKIFCELFRKHFGHVDIKPLCGNSMLASLREYAFLGLPGCVGSIDAVFVPWDMVPTHLSNLCKGDKGKGLLYETIVTHCKRVISIEGSYYSTINDKNSVKYCEFLSNLKDKKIYKDISYKIRTGPSVDDFVELSSVYVIADGGYLEWSTIVSAFGVSSYPTEYKFSDWIGSVRKDVECFYGILKKRFRFFKCPITLHNQDDIDNAYWTCCMIHNMILEHDGLDRLWEDGANWEALNPNNDIIDETNTIISDYIYSFTVHDPDTFIPVYAHDLIPENEIHSYDNNENNESVQHDILKRLLANHLQIMYREGKVRWPKHRKDAIDNFRVNELVRLNLPNIGDLEV